MIYRCNKCDHYFQSDRLITSKKSEPITCAYCGSDDVLAYYEMPKVDLINDIAKVIDYHDETKMMKYVFDVYNDVLDGQNATMANCDDDIDDQNAASEYDDDD